ncbi:DUF6944 family repetitive protein [Alkalihalobacterium chitinilyticum]|uniref:Uncharacterized protein n=1 Tax=Alkalihalobacterium chitinilyticum TaxID=2980103 RepID=A0ABT5VIA3_9BACI|nr:hypothetical protein [Alkalihalobacterium chitinilyticum]MDE5415181.1 hypothetical protein [Alkalihalobacterium chitinilyticum]
MSEQYVAVTGSWLDAIGQILSAIGYTLQLQEERDANIRKVVIGEGVQAVGNALQAVVEEDPIARTGDWIEAGGAATTSIAVALQLEEENLEYQRLEVVGDSLQSLGPAISASVEDNNELFVALYLQSIGAAIEAIGGLKEIRGLGRLGLQFSAIGNWIQVLGTTLQAVVLTRELITSEYEEFPSQGNNE